MHYGSCRSTGFGLQLTDDHNRIRRLPIRARAAGAISQFLALWKGSASSAKGERCSTSVARVTRGGVTAFGIYIAGAGLAYCSQLLIAKIVGPDTFGIYAYVLAWMVVLAYFCALGFDVALVRFVPAYRAGQAWALAKGVIQFAERCSMAVGIGVVAIGIIAVEIAKPGMSPPLKSTFLAGFMLVPALALL